MDLTCLYYPKGLKAVGFSERARALAAEPEVAPTLQTGKRIEPYIVVKSRYQETRSVIVIELNPF